MVVLKTDQPADCVRHHRGSKGSPNRFDEDAKGLTNVGETGDPAMKPGTRRCSRSTWPPGHYAIVCNLTGHYAAGMHQDFWVTPTGSTPVTATLADTSSTKMSIELSQPYAPAGQGQLPDHQRRHDGPRDGGAQDRPARRLASTPSTGFEGEPNRFDEDAKGLTNVGETGDPAMKPGTQKMLTIDMAAGHYAIVCNLSGHYAAGMHQDFLVTPTGSTPVTATLADTSSTEMSITLSRALRPGGQGQLPDHQRRHDGPRDGGAQDRPARRHVRHRRGSRGSPNRFDEDAKGLTNVGETGDPAMKPGTSKMLTIDMAAGHYAIVCNLTATTPPGCTRTSGSPRRICDRAVKPLRVRGGSGSECP